MTRRPRPRLLLILGFLLVFAQQAAVAHLISHLGASTHEVAAPDGDPGHGAALSLSHVCTTCLAFSALQAAPPQAQLFVPTVEAPLPAPMAVSTAPASRFEPRYRSRAPPAFS